MILFSRNGDSLNKHVFIANIREKINTIKHEEIDENTLF